MDILAFLQSVVLIGTVLSIAVWLKTRSMAFPVGFFFIYFWGLHGAWAIISQKSGKFLPDGNSFAHLETKMFPIDLNDEYYLTLIYYSVFLLTVQICVLIFARTMPSRSTAKARPVQIDLWALLILSGVCAAAAVYLMADRIGESITRGISVYTTGYSGGTYKTFDSIAAITASIGFSVALSGMRGRFLVGRKTWFLIVCYGSLLISLYAFNLVIGRKSPLVYSLIFISLFYWVNSPTPPKLIRFVLIGVLGIWAIFTINFTRGTSLGDLSEFEWARLINVFYTIIYTNEAYGAHFSLYGLLHFDVPIEPWVSLKFIILSIPPAFLDLSRPEHSYDLYSAGTELTAGQGYSIHHAAGWYMNFGSVGVVIGAITLATVWVLFFNKFCELDGKGPEWRRVLWTIAPWCFTAYLPLMMRAGPEAYKGFFMAELLAPMALLMLSVTVSRMRGTGLNYRTGRGEREVMPS